MFEFENICRCVHTSMSFHEKRHFVSNAYGINDKIMSRTKQNGINFERGSKITKPTYYRQDNKRQFEKAKKKHILRWFNNIHLGILYKWIIMRRYFACGKFCENMIS
jgi:hypothetical protein